MNLLNLFSILERRLRMSASRRIWVTENRMRCLVQFSWSYFSFQSEISTHVYMILGGNQLQFPMISTETK